MTDEFFDGLIAIIDQGTPSEVESYISYEILKAQRVYDGKTAVGALYSMLGAYYSETGSYSKAEESYKLALDAFESAGLAYSVQYVTVILSISSLQAKTSRQQESIASLVEAKSAMETSGMDSMYLYASTVMMLCQSYIKVREYEKAIELGIIACQKANSLLEPDQGFAAWALSAVAQAYMEIGDLENAEKSAANALSLFEDFSYEDPKHSQALSIYGLINYKKGNYAVALEAFERSLPLTKRFYGINTNYMAICFNIFRTCQALGMNVKAYEWLSEAHSRAQTVLGDSHPYTSKFGEVIGSITPGGNEDSAHALYDI
ncbi:MAG: tetratricopeptide repeat protein [Eubacteriaceae bacterium]|nr:tetratricopeptide repeat protein [Eubacteriaceae bacterium]